MIELKKWFYNKLILGKFTALYWFIIVNLS
jgi:hypothetical protein